MTELVDVLNNPEEHYPGNFDTPQRANALLTGLCQQAADEIKRVNKALTWEQNRSTRIGTHGPGCHTWGPSHYECLLRVNAELVATLNDIAYRLEQSRIWGGMDWTYHPMHPVKYLPLIDQARAALDKATGETK